MGQEKISLESSYSFQHISVSLLWRIWLC